MFTFHAHIHYMWPLVTMGACGIAAALIAWLVPRPRWFAPVLAFLVMAPTVGVMMILTGNGTATDLSTHDSDLRTAVQQQFHVQVNGSPHYAMGMDTHDQLHETMELSITRNGVTRPCTYHETSVTGNWRNADFTGYITCENADDMLKPA